MKLGKLRKRYRTSTARHKIHVVRGSGSENQRFLLWFGAHAPTYILAYGDHLEEALEEAVDWIVDHKPGLLADEEMNSAYAEAIAAGKSEEDAQEYASQDLTTFGHSGFHALRSDDWGIVAENPTRAQILQVQERLKEHRATGVDPLYVRAHSRAKTKARVFNGGFVR